MAKSPLTPGYNAPGAQKPATSDPAPDDFALRALESLLAGEYDHAPDTGRQDRCEEALKGITPARLRRLAALAPPARAGVAAHTCPEGQCPRGDLAHIARLAALRPYIGWSTE